MSQSSSLATSPRGLPTQKCLYWALFATVNTVLVFKTVMILISKKYIYTKCVCTVLLINKYTLPIFSSKVNFLLNKRYQYSISHGRSYNQNKYN